ncbi:MAG: ABC transporter permease [Candidatus Riflebacteria bacterium]|nr:ABC transporter permease [Candidatus Riflebacteria bacterium]
MSAMIIANALLIFVLSMNAGMIWDIIGNATEVIQGHITVSSKGYLDHPTINSTIVQSSDVRNRILSSNEVKGVCGRVSCFALLSHGQDENCRTMPAEVLGIEPSEEMNISRISRSVTEGKFISDSSAKEIVLGKGLAQNLNAAVGGEIVLMGQAADGSIAAELFRITGIFDTGDSIRDSSLAVSGRKTVQEVFCLENRVHTWNIFLNYPLKAKPISEMLRKVFPDEEITPWQKLLPQIAEILQFFLAIQIIAMAIFYMAVFLVSSNTMYMAFLERVREFAIMSAIGLSPRRLSILLLTEGLILSTISAFIGTSSGIIISLYIQRFPINLDMFFTTLAYCGSTIQPRIVCLLTPDLIFMPFITMILLGPVITLFPVIKLSGVRPVDALREG